MSLNLGLGPSMDLQAWSLRGCSSPSHYLFNHSFIRLFVINLESIHHSLLYSSFVHF